ncbi:Hypothetical predicted protein [Olea europaea subsp. europaea]|uniref:Uncharacterized protein n=1 Tax=Olea europaea subsp. europaea TaxID=158383 RepID=A0A8S0RU32_OLEEU|nr:Hypothetical predicted protein [Olea europaea subsp. europaea]
MSNFDIVRYVKQLARVKVSIGVNTSGGGCRKASRGPNGFVDDPPMLRDNQAVAWLGSRPIAWGSLVPRSFVILYFNTVFPTLSTFFPDRYEDISTSYTPTTFPHVLMYS